MSEHKTLLFLCTGNFYRSRYAELLFNALAARKGLPWRAESRGVALEYGVHNVGPMSVAVGCGLKIHGITLDQEVRFPLQAKGDDFEKAALVIALKEVEHRPFLEERYPSWANRVEYWHIHDVDCGSVADALAGIEREVEALIVRLSQETGASGSDLPTAP